MSDDSKLYVPPHRRNPLGDITNIHPDSCAKSTSSGTSVREPASSLCSRIRPPRFSIHERPGPGPRKSRLGSPASFTLIAAHHAGLGERVLDTDLDPKDLDVKEGEAITNVEYVGSYKWVESEDERPTIAVPALPDIWEPPEQVGRLELDKFLPNYQEFPDYAAALLPDNLSTLEPTFLCLNSPSTLAGIDIVIGRNNLRRLWSALDPEYSGHSHPFRIDMVSIGGLLLLDRFNPDAEQESKEPSGFHLSYHETTTRALLEGSDRTPGCIRVIKYSFGGLSMMVKFDVAAFIPPDNWRYHLSSEGSTNTEMGVTPYIDDESLDGVSTNMDGLEFDDPVYNGHSIAIHHTRLVPPPQSSLVSIKTKIHHHQPDLHYYFPQMYFAQVSRLHYARHNHGDFSKYPLEVYNVLAEAYQDTHQGTVDQMGAMLRWLVNVAKEYGGDGKPLGLVWDGRRFSVLARREGPELSAPVTEMIRDARLK